MFGISNTIDGRFYNHNSNNRNKVITKRGCYGSGFKPDTVRKEKRSGRVRNSSRDNVKRVSEVFLVIDDVDSLSPNGTTFRLWQIQFDLETPTTLSLQQSLDLEYS